MKLLIVSTRYHPSLLILYQLLAKDKSKRLGYAADAEEVLKHPFFASLDLNKMLKQEVEAPFKPEMAGDGLNV